MSGIFKRRRPASDGGDTTATERAAGESERRAENEARRQASDAEARRQAAENEARATSAQSP
jgi:hypothetical protein